MSLRARLITGLAALTIAVLLVVDVATYFSVRQFLVERVDRQLEASIGSAIAELTRVVPQDRTSSSRTRPLPPILPPGTYIELRAPDGTVLNSLTYGFGDAVYSPPSLSGPLVPPESRQWSEVASVDGDVDYRVLVQPLIGDDRAVVIALPLGNVDDTLQQLVVVEVAVSGAALLVILGGAFFLVRLGLRPLDRFAATAGEVARGDLSRRVTPSDGRTEVGRLGVALNYMLSRIEDAFRQKTESEERLRRFVADASHELRTPLTSIRGFAELVSSGPALSPEDTANAARRIEQQSNRMGALVDDLLLLARLDEGQELSLELCDLADVVQATADEARLADPSRELTISTTPACVMGDQTRLHQAVANLLANARQHTPPGTPVHITLSRDNGTAVVAIADEGPGLPESDLPHLFERFYRADKSRSRQNGGSGLGLAIVKSIVEGHAGAVSAGNAPGGGARFTISIPIHS